LRVLSAPCSTGEEPYSIAITLLDVGLLPQDFEIDAIDISQHALTAAARGLYRQNSFRGVDTDFRARYFEPGDGGFLITPQVRACVRFSQGNLVDPALLSKALSYQVIFCRNVLIYMHEAARKTALGSLCSALDPRGYLFAGHAEAVDGMSPHFVREKGAAAFRRRDGSLRPSAAAKPQPGRPASIAARARANSAAPSRSLALAREYAARGEYERAAALCEQELSDHGPTAEAYAVLGGVRRGQGQLHQAESTLHRALYLEPNHGEALRQMTLVCEARGDHVAAERFRKRARQGPSGPR
jgi:chemotaxis protein methyltransferase WspC